MIIKVDTEIELKQLEVSDATDVEQKYSKKIRIQV
ncbi:hypothetical protein SDC9_126073 [bioreactor metagenome]|uniref:Uncharacterized protein n=1 Tax=bioreactor metagenome TaxID=1076179 RepID=A0A645CQP5_9ZZZZ